MAERDPGRTFRQTKSNRIVRRLMELVTVAVVLGVALYFPSRNTERVFLGALAFVIFVGLSLRRKWR